MTPFSLEEFDHDSLQKWAIRAEKELSTPLSTLPPWVVGQKLAIEPYLTKDELNTVKTGLNQRAQKQSAGWQNLPYIKRKDFASIIKSLTKILPRGVHGATLGLSQIVYSQHSFHNLITSIVNTGMLFFLELPDSKHDITLHTFPDTFRGGIAYDPLANWMRTAEFDQDYIFKIAEYSKMKKVPKHFYPLQVQSHVFHEAGADSIQELALTIASLVHYLDILTEMNLSPQQAISGMYFSLSIGSKYLTEIAKIRAFRILLKQIVAHYDIGAESFTPFIHCQTSSLYIDSLDGHTGMVRCSSAAMGAVTGGCDALTIMPFESADDSEKDTFENLAQSLPLLLAHEGKMSAIADPLAGSCLIEKMTEEMTVAAWDLFLHIENLGGIVPYFERGDLQQALNANYALLLQSLRRDITPSSGESTDLRPESISAQPSACLKKRNVPDDLRNPAFFNSPKA